MPFIFKCIGEIYNLSLLWKFFVEYLAAVAHIQWQRACTLSALWPTLITDNILCALLFVPSCSKQVQVVVSCVDNSETRPHPLPNFKELIAILVYWHRFPYRPVCCWAVVLVFRLTHLVELVE